MITEKCVFSLGSYCGWVMNEFTWDTIVNIEKMCVCVYLCVNYLESLFCHIRHPRTPTVKNPMHDVIMRKMNVNWILREA